MNHDSSPFEYVTYSRLTLLYIIVLLWNAVYLHKDKIEEIRKTKKSRK